jgi:hypothetical protein
MREVLTENLTVAQLVKELSPEVLYGGWTNLHSLYVFPCDSI